MIPRPRPEIEALPAYRPPRERPRILLHANESPYPLPDEVRAHVMQELSRADLHRYPDGESTALRGQIAAYCGVDPDWIWVGSGSNEVLLNAALAFGGQGRSALLFEPTYAMHRRQAVIAGTTASVVPRGRDFRLDVSAAVDEIQTHDPALVFLASPDNPTGVLTEPDDVARLASAGSGLLVLDEAYHEFCGVTFLPRLREFQNVMVVRTLSKAFRLAGVRVGWAVAHPDVIAWLVRVRMPYGQSVLAQTTARVVLENRKAVLAHVDEIVAERDRIAEALAASGAEVFGSRANFVLFRPRDAESLLARLSGAGILIRDFRTTPYLEGCLRVTAGRPEENEEFLEVVASSA
ncbi:MAG TPA: histidinol-phosphate transaminase [Actinomycetota bacterium]|nr:histidinol-phosphate transaminase [Actinomycetota bacterium]